MEMNVFRVPEWTLGENIYVGQGSGRLFGYDYAPHPVVPRMVKSSPVGGLLERVAFRRALHPSLVGDVSALAVGQRVMLKRAERPVGSLVSWDVVEVAPYSNRLK